MTETLVSSSRRSSKTTCRKCNRTIHVVTVTGVEGPMQVETDPELISVIIFEAKKPAVEHARRLHAERCDEYQRESAKAKVIAERKAWDAEQDRAKRAPKGPREPGQ